MIGPDRAGLIRDLCDRLSAEIVQPDGSLGIGNKKQDALKLLANGIQFHELTLPEIRAACVGLTRVLILPGMNVVIDADHEHFWSWMGEILVGGHNGYLTHQEDRETRNLLSAVFHVTLVFSSRASSDALMSLGVHAREALIHSQDMGAYITFPLLEALLRRACSANVSPSGTVLLPFAVTLPTGKVRPYASNSTCSNFGHLLRHVLAERSMSDLASDIGEILDHVSSLTGNDGIDALFGWRNSSLHGEASLPTIAGTVLNISILLALDEIAADYENLRTAAVAQMAWKVQRRGSGYRPGWDFYPP